ncbi:MAG: sulfatase-like hydrolase/transferase, partial [Armatimonadetes bacterium]|nr:sulfatase-like hydrolase/transferase [Armatimonadota bacterium]
MQVVLISIDTLRADHLSCYGYPRPTSPNLDKLAAEGVLFENCISGSCHTTPAFASMVSGQDPFHHGVIATLWAARNDLTQRLDDRTPTLPEILYTEGWATYAVDNLFHFSAFPSWHARGYLYYINVNPPGQQ